MRVAPKSTPAIIPNCVSKKGTRALVVQAFLIASIVAALIRPGYCASDTVAGIIAPYNPKGSYEFVDNLMRSITNEREVEVSEKAVLEPVLYAHFARLKRKSCVEIPGIGSIAGQDPPTFKRYRVHVLKDNDKIALVKVFSRAKTETGTSILDLTFDLRKFNGGWKIFDVCSTGEKPHYCYRSEVKNWEC